MAKREPLFLEPALKGRIWGGTKLHDVFGYTLPSNETGECWGISAHPNGPSTIKNGELKGLTLNQAWDNHRELFGNFESNEFPLLTKILDAKTDLSVQVHPNDQYAREKEGEPYGKTECWYIIDCEEGAEIIYGHHGASPEDFRQKVEAGEWEQLLRKVKVKPGDFFYVPSGTIHAIGGGIMILETQQSSDITYRVYDYDRTEAEGNTRELHINQSIEVTNYPHTDPVLEYKVKQESEALFTELVREQYFTVHHWDVRGKMEKTQSHPFLLMSVIKGEGKLEIDGESYDLNKGDHLILPSTIESYTIKGQCELIISHP